MSDRLSGGVDHVAIAARDPGALADWYCRALGFRVLSDNGKERPTRLLAGDAGALIEMMPDNQTPARGRELFNPGISHLAIRVDDLEAAVARLNEHGVQSAPPIEAAGGGRIANFADPEGNALQFVERPAGWGS